LQQLFEENFDEEVTLFPRVKKLQKLDLNFNVVNSDVDIQSVEVRQKVEKSIDLDAVRLELMPSVSVQDSPLGRISYPKRATSNQFVNSNRKGIQKMKNFQLDLPKASEASNEESLN
jgi:hypothetical protein